MDEYTPIDLIAFHNAGLALLGEQGTAPIGPQQFRGLPFLIGTDPQRCFVAFGDGLQHAPLSIPIWVASMWPSKAPLRRAARWDGIIPIGRDLPLAAMLTPAQMYEIVHTVASQPGYTAPFEVVHSGITGGTDAAYDREFVATYLQVGVTWWVEKILPELWGSWTDWPLETMRTRIRQGPPR